MAIMTELALDGRPFVPVRLIPYATGWSISPDVLIKMLSNSDQWHRVFIPSYHLLPDKSYQAMLPKEWDVFLADIQILDDELHADETIEQGNYPTWRKQAIKVIPAGTFVWLDDFEAAFTRMESRIIRTDERPGDRDINLQPFIPQDMRELIYVGFEEQSEYEKAWADFTEILPRLKDELSELKAIQPKSMDDRREKYAEIKKIEDQIEQIKGENNTAVEETPSLRAERLAQWRDEEISKLGIKGAIERVAKREGVSRQRISQILNSQD